MLVPLTISVCHFNTRLEKRMDKSNRKLKIKTDKQTIVSSEKFNKNGRKMYLLHSLLQYLLYQCEFITPVIPITYYLKVDKKFKVGRTLFFNAVISVMTKLHLLWKKILKGIVSHFSGQPQLLPCCKQH